jgi:cellulose synthase operon protein YhjU
MSIVIKKGRWESRDPLGVWGAYFGTKAVLHLLGYLRMQFWLNTFFLVFLLLPMPKALSEKRWANPARQTLNVVLALLLLWSDSWLPSLAYAVDFFSKYDLPSFGYMARFFATTFLSWTTLGVAVFLFAYHRVSRTVFLTPVVFIMLMMVGFKNRSLGATGPIDARLQNFFEMQSREKIRFPGEQERAGLPDFDVYFLHVCSLAWDDLYTAGLDRHEFLEKDLDIVFSRFNSVTSHSTPSALRLLRGPCGQPDHGDLYVDSMDPDCYLFDALRRAGYKTYTAYAHDGEYGDMKGFIQQKGRGDPPLLPEGLAPYQTNFDGRPLFGPFDSLERVREIREKDGAARAAIYMNLVTLHGGAHEVGEKGWWRTKRTDHYRKFFDKLTSDLNRFFGAVETSGRKAVVFFVPEHGLGLRGSSIQGNDLREIPLPYITIVPAGVKLLGLEKDSETSLKIDTRVSHLALSYILDKVLRRKTLEGPNSSIIQEITAEIPETPYVAQNSDQVVMQAPDGLFLRGKDGAWRRMPDDVAVRGEPPALEPS